jgi:hypothetical protein
MSDWTPQRAYAELTKELKEAEALLDAGVHNEESLREAFGAAEDLLLELDDVESRMLAEIDRAREADDA